MKRNQNVPTFGPTMNACPRMIALTASALVCSWVLTHSAFGFQQDNDSKLQAFQSDFKKGMKGWTVTDPDCWKTLKGKDGKHVLSLHKKKSSYQPKVRSPFHIALLDQPQWESFQLDVEILSTHKDYNHRDVCLFFGYQGPHTFYYVHLGKRTDAHANQVFIVNKKPRTKISTQTSKGTPWTEKWHHVRIRRNVTTGTVQVYFDDMETPCMTAKDKTFAKGQIGLGSFDDTADFRNLKIKQLTIAEKPKRSGKTQ